MRREIGSEFHNAFQESTRKGIIPSFQMKEELYVFSGRTAIETVLLNQKNIKKALLPSYCCDSMIDPFRVAGIEVAFYDVYYDETLRVQVKLQNDIDLILWCNYFGFEHEMPDFTDFLQRGGILVEDITHSFMSKNPYHKEAQYLVASIRKWFPILSGGFCATNMEHFGYRPKKEVPTVYIDTKKNAMIRKAMYLENGDEGKKDLFLSEFSQSNTWLKENYEGLKIDEESMKIIQVTDFDSVRKKRIDNAKIIYEKLKLNNNVQALFPIEDMQCPLFVPIMFKNSTDRGIVRNKLIEHKIYCPIHWPKPNESCESNIYDRELSLICDQRYDADDIEYMMEIICNIK